MKIIYFLSSFLFGAIVYAHGQSPVPEPDTLKNQVRQVDPVPQTMPHDANYTANKIKITSTELPEGVKRSLNAGSEYEGWQKGTAYKSKDGKEFILEMREADTLRIFRFDKNGKLLIE
ncbi:MAG TPA: hypothetical protein VGD65_01070 [Chryseosolibacter sp.]